ncbi:LuxR C-terminal-related transcriptional regulator [Streptomyces sp. B1-3]|uniref:helix-turn-helix transcriptional regulator n=1 Tax=Streptomyces sp. B1-3 TaxID=3141453 RepID=UPI003D298F97
MVTASSSSRLHLSLALVSGSGLVPNDLSADQVRLVTEPCHVRADDDVVLFYGQGMARELMRFRVALGGVLPPTVVLAHSLDWGDVSLALEQGAIGYLLENRYAFLLNEALLCASRGTGFLDPVVAAAWVRSQAVTEARPDRRSVLSQRERQVMDLLASGMKVREVAQRMVLTEKSVRNYLSRIYHKLAVRGQSEAILYWIGRLEIPPCSLPGEAPPSSTAS